MEILINILLIYIAFVVLRILIGLCNPKLYINADNYILQEYKKGLLTKYKLLVTDTPMVDLIRNNNVSKNLGTDYKRAWYFVNGTVYYYNGNTSITPTLEEFEFLFKTLEVPFFDIFVRLLYIKFIIIAGIHAVDKHISDL